MGTAAMMAALVGCEANVDSSGGVGDADRAWAIVCRLFRIELVGLCSLVGDLCMR